MFANYGYQKLVCYDCKEYFDFLPRHQPKCISILSNDSALAEIGRFQIMHNGHHIELIHEDDEDIDHKLISTFERTADFELSGHISRILRLVYPDKQEHLSDAG